MNDKKFRIYVRGNPGLLLTHKGASLVLHDSPPFFGLYDNGHDPSIVPVVEVFRNILLLIDHHVGVGIHQDTVHLLKHTCKTGGITDNKYRILH